MERETIEAITGFRQFKTESRRLSNELGLSDEDGRHELLIELTQHRLSGWTDQDIVTAIADNSPTFSWKVTYSKRDCLRTFYKAQRQQQQATHELAATAKDSYSIIDMSRASRTQEDINAAIELLDQLFTNAKTRNWCRSVLQHGQSETMSRYHQSKRQFNQKLNRVTRYCSEHRERTIGIMKSRNDNNEMKELKSLTQWANMMANEDVTDKQLQRYITQHGELVADIVDNPAIKHQGKLVADWANADHADQYAFCNLMAARKEQLERYLTLR